ncbi:MAG: hypothetical protein JWQ21_3792 [Herminiimonas sp.]|nr:hypothetical protein [Herminiimonas sp.]
MRVLIALAFAISSVAGAAQAQSIEAPIPTQGDSWQFQTINLWTSNLISRTSKKTIGASGEYVRSYFDTQSIGQNGEIMKPEVSEGTARADLNQVVMYRGEKQERTWYKWPLVQGKKWSHQIKEELPPIAGATQTRTITSTVNAEVIGWETLEVPAGKFKTMKIVYKTSWVMDSPSATGVGMSTSWYSPDAKINVQSVYESFGADGSPQVRTKTQLIHYQVNKS